MTNRRDGIISTLLALFIALVFLQSLFFKFTDSPETLYIFGAIEAWGASLGLPGLFAKGGIFSAYVVGSAELVASALLLASLLGPALRGLRPIGALLSLGVISGAIFFHLATPLGVAVRNADGSSDGGFLFAMACGVWLSAAVLLYQERGRIRTMLGRAAVPAGD